MIRISSRDSYSYIHPSIIEKRKKELERINDYTKFDKYEQYTPEIIVKIQKDYTDGKIKENIEMNKESIAWENTEGYSRSNGLPAVMYRDGDIEYWLNGNPHREDGPCFIFHNFHGDKLRLRWDKESNSNAEGFFLAGAIINEHGSKRYYTGTCGSDDEIGKEEYETIIKREFPKATKIWLDQYL